MIEDLFIHNQFQESIGRFREFDPHLKKIRSLPFKYRSQLIDEPAFGMPGIFLITGGRQVGKTTFLKQFILALLEKGADQGDILFITGELIDSHHILRRAVETFHKTGRHQHLFIDEVNYIPDWDKSIKYLADSGVFDKMSVILTGSDSVIIRSAMKRFAGRRGPADRTDFIFHPLSFKEYILLRDPGSKQILSKIMKTSLQEQVAGYPEKHAELTRYLEGYMLHGGYLPAISAYLTGNTIPGSVYNIYTEWIIGDILKYNKSENYLHEVLKGILSSYSSQVSWNSLAKHLSIDHHKTVSDYCQILSSVHVLYILEALEEHKLAGAPKKNKKMYFRDPFIYHAASSYIDGRIPYESLEKKIKDPAYASYLAETVVIDHCQRHAKTFYIKGNKGEVDAAIIRGRRFYPVEVKWTKQLRVEELKQILTYKNGFVLTPRAEHGAIGNLTVIPLIRFLLSDIGCL